jgi:DNA polymerase
MRRRDIIDCGLFPSFCEYAAQDVRLLKGIFNKLAPDFPRDEYRVMDLVLRCAVEPRLVMNIPKLEAYYEHVKADKAKLIDACGFDKAQLMSAGAFKSILEGLGVVVEHKISATGNEIPALAKSDEFMSDLQEHPDPQVQAVVAARLGVKSTLDEARAERLLAIARLPWHIAGLPVGTMPIPLRYAGAHTQRLSGHWKINMQNLPSGRGSTSSELRDALEAPPGYKVVVCDLGQIEARLTAWLTRAPLLETFKAGEDPYCMMASAIFGRPITKADEFERFVGKSAVLGLGFGLGKDNFYIKTAAGARLQGLDLGDKWTQALADRTVDTYRRVQHPTKSFWRLLDDHLERAWAGRQSPATLGPVTIGHGYVEGPGGLRMLYHLPDEGVQTAEIWYSYGGRSRKIYGAAFLENIIQFLARVILMNAALRLHATKIPFLRFVHQAHDELVYVVPDKFVDRAKIIVHSQMIIPPSWGPDIPLKADVGSAQAYGSAK